MKKIWSVRIFVFTILWIILNYVTYYLDDLLMAYGWSATSLTVQGIQAIAFPITWYVQVIEPYTLFAIPILGRAFNYCIELSYFYGLVWLIDLLVSSIDVMMVKPIQHYFGIHEKNR